MFRGFKRERAEPDKDWARPIRESRVRGPSLLSALLVALMVLSLPFFYPLYQQSLCTRNVRALAAAMEAYSRDYGELPLNQYQVVPEYLERVPICPSAERTTYRTTFRPPADCPNESAVAFVVECCGKNHTYVLPNLPAAGGILGGKP